MNAQETAARLLRNYAIWGIAAILAFGLFLLFLYLVIISHQLSLLSVFAVLISGFLWIGATAISRHAFILLKQYIGKEVSMLEFVSTQFVVVLFPLVYATVKNEVEEFRKKCMKDR